MMNILIGLPVALLPDEADEDDVELSLDALVLVSPEPELDEPLSSPQATATSRRPSSATAQTDRLNRDSDMRSLSRNVVFQMPSGPGRHPSEVGSIGVERR
jgi:hypothetical protein